MFPALRFGPPLNVAIIAAAVLWLFPAQADAVATVRTQHATVTLLAEGRALSRSGANWLAVKIDPQRGWHTYWRNPGDAGLPMRLHWTLPPRVKTGPIRWPAPKLLTLGGIANYGYDQPTLHLVPLTLPPDWPLNQSVRLGVAADWLVCKTICVPEHAELSVTLPVSAGGPTTDAADAALFAQARERLPQALPNRWTAHYAIHAGVFSLGIRGGALPDGKAYFFPDSGRLIEQSKTQRAAFGPDGLRMTVPSASDGDQARGIVGGVLEIQTGSHTVAYRIRAVPGEVPAVSAEETSPPPSSSADFSGGGVFLVLALALLGGLGLNLMPCVFPVLSIKALALIEGRTLTRSAQRMHGLSYTAGVVMSCVAAAAALLAFRSGGRALGWGFQLQSPWFVAVLAELMFVMGLSLSGVVSFGNRLMGTGQTLTRPEGYAGSFFTGVLAVVVASPCSAPFMGTALGYALTQPAAVALWVFAALGLGLALPFLLIGLFPSLIGWLPRPGAWMATFKQLMAFPLYLTAVWLLWVLMHQRGPDAAALTLIGMVVLAVGCWAVGRWHGSRLALAALLASVVGAGLLLALPNFSSRAVPNVAAADSKPMIQRYSDARLAKLRRQGRTVFVDFTADWCITCKVNEHLVLDSGSVHRLFQRHHVVWLVGDWTRPNPEITRVLKRFGRPGVPLYLVYRDGRAAQVLPQILTPEILAHAVDHRS